MAAVETIDVNTLNMKEITREEVLSILEDPVQTAYIRKKFADAPLVVDSNTFQPYKIVDDRLYIIEAVQDMDTLMVKGV